MKKRQIYEISKIPQIENGGTNANAKKGQIWEMNKNHQIENLRNFF